MEFLYGIEYLAKEYERLVNECERLTAFNHILILLLVVAVIVIVTLCVELHKMDKLLGGKDNND